MLIILIYTNAQDVCTEVMPIFTMFRAEMIFDHMFFDDILALVTFGFPRMDFSTRL